MPPEPIRVGVVCDFREEGWHSMDLIGDTLMEMLPEVSNGAIVATRLLPPMPRRWSRVPVLGEGRRAMLADRLTGRFHDYPRWLAKRAGDCDVFHIVDHSYAHLVRVLPAGRTVVTCNDVDAIQSVLPGARKTFDPMRLIAAPILEGLSQAARVSCISHATRDQLLQSDQMRPERVSVAYLGAHPSCSPAPVPRWDKEIALRLGGRGTELLHVGSTIPRKRIETLIEILRGVREQRPDVRLLRVGDPLNESQRALAASRGVADAIVQMPFLERPALAAVYRRAALALLPSDREGFGLPLVEAMSCGTPVVASSIAALQEVGGSAAEYCAPGDVAAWVDRVLQMLTERDSQPERWNARRTASLQAAAKFDWRTYSESMVELYRDVALQQARPVAAATA